MTELLLEFNLFDFQCKAIIDHVADLGNMVFTLSDIKTSSYPVNRFHEKIKSWKIYRQLAFYEYALRAIKEQDIKIHFYVIAVQTTDVFQVMPYKIDRDLIDYGKEEIKELFKRINFHLKKDEWIHQKELIESNIPIVSLKTFESC